ncbi:hypothetical protein C2845_PM11G08200 [Panicum miliaceum]|uniref:RNase H type-1 domain-containing protein n=1 Tax=Panicum miliaceum TaxID=4540 RepID=A0A3L6RRC7_PANMI|nr:hypothetical protein C2845_PM11G08200 [Panicum miliaceum]
MPNPCLHKIRLRRRLQFHHVEDLMCLEAKVEKPTRVPGRWTRPQENWVKVSTDASFLAASSTGAEGVAIRDSDGRLLSAAARRYVHAPDALTGEALAARNGLLLVGEQGYDKLFWS